MKIIHCDLPVVIYGDQGCGKTLAGKYLQIKFGKQKIIDDGRWNGKTPLQPETLTLTCLEPPFKADVKAISFKQAMQVE